MQQFTTTSLIRHDCHHYHDFVAKQPKRLLSTSSVNYKITGPPDPAGPVPDRKNFRESIMPPDWLKLVERYPDFLPEPFDNSPLLVAKQVEDMLKRREVIEIPEFYVGSILAITCSDKYSETKRSKFVGLCIQRTGQLLKSNFTLRNVIDGMGIEIRYELYNPLILSIEVLRLEKRLDEELIYLRDAPQEYSTVPLDMKPEVREEGAEVPVNKIRVKMNPMPWTRRWEKRQLRGIEKLENVPELWVNRAKEIEMDNVNNYDTLMEYRRHCTEEQMYTICKRLAEHEKNVVNVRKEALARRFLRIAKRPPLAENKGPTTARATDVGQAKDT